MDETHPRSVVAVLTTAPDLEVAGRLAESLVEERLVACANILPGGRSIYRWEGELRHDDEVMLLLKSTPDLASVLCARIEELHPYDLPEVLVFPVPSASDRYSAWVHGEVRTP